MEWMLMPLKRYADFSGRSRRMEYWMFILFQVLLYVAIVIVGGLLLGLGDAADSGLGFAGGTMTILLILVALGLIVPNIAVQVRRFHDQDITGWLVLLNLIPYLGGLIVLVMMFLEGTRGPNQYGPDPKAAADGQPTTI